MDRTLDDLRAIITAGPPYPRGLLRALKDDGRAGAQALYQSALRAQECAEKEGERLAALMSHERQAVANGFARIAGVDEAGRGPLAGPIVAGAVVLAGPIEGVNDSKQLTHTQRQEIYEAIYAGGHSVGVGIIDAETIDRHGIQSANYAAMAQAVAQLDPPPDFLLVDGFQIKGCPLPQEAIIKGDCVSASIAAASIVAKVVRDGIMFNFDHQYPGYGFAEHKGYATRDHFAALTRLGACPIHRRSFAPVANREESGLLFEL